MRFSQLVVANCSVLLLSGCTHVPEGGLKGDVPLVIVNRTTAPFKSVRLVDAQSSKSAYPLDPLRHEPSIPPGGNIALKVRPGALKLDVVGDGGAKTSGPTLLKAYLVNVTGPTSVVVYEGEKPSGGASPGYAEILVPSYEIEQQAKRAADAAAVKSRQDECVARVPSKAETPAPGPIRASGKWQCVLGGAYTGTDYVTLAQLADGRISATLAGADRNQAWEGVVIKDEVHFRFSNTSSDGGILKLDPSGHSMRGDAYTYRNGKCNHWTLTCTK